MNTAILLIGTLVPISAATVFYVSDRQVARQAVRRARRDASDTDGASTGEHES